GVAHDRFQPWRKPDAERRGYWRAVEQDGHRDVVRGLLAAQLHRAERAGAEPCRHALRGSGYGSHHRQHLDVDREPQLALRFADEALSPDRRSPGWDARVEDRIS